MVDKNSEYYFYKNVPYTRVTRILNVIAKEKLLWWYGAHGTKECRRISKERMAFGTQFHRNAHAILQKKDTYIRDDEVELCNTVELFIKWSEKHKVKPLFLEHGLLNEEYGYAGTADFIGYIDDVFILADWKTGKQIYEESFLQLAAYVKAFECEYTKEKVKAGMVVSFRDGIVQDQLVSRDELENLFQVFLAAKKIHDWKQGHV